jgi:glycosyltransferase involved in cell wall biosynthesis
MFRILYIIDGLRAGGKERQLVEVLKYLNSNSSIKTGIISFNRENHYSEEVRKLVSFFTVLKKRPTRLEPFFTIWKSFWQFKPDIIHTWDSLSSMYAYLPAKLSGSKIIDGSIRDAGIDNGWMLWIKRFYLKRADLILGNSFAGLKYYGVNGEVLHNSIDITRFRTRFENTECNVIMVANFTEYKDHETFINASLTLVLSEKVDNIYMAGDGRHKSYYIELINTKYKDIAHKFHFLGTIRNVEEYMGKCKFGILCSTREYAEGVPNSVLEYMAAGLIAIATNVGGVSEIITDGINGFLVEPNDANRIIEIIDSINKTDEVAKDIIDNAKQTILHNFSPDKNVSKLMNIYSDLCKTRN